MEGGERASLEEGEVVQGPCGARRKMPKISLPMARATANPLFLAPTGRLGNVILMTGPKGQLILRERIIGRNPKTADQAFVRSNLGFAAKAWGRLSDEERSAFDAYGETVGRDGYRAFTGLASKYRQVHAGVSPPSRPPTEPFFGDSVGVSAALGPEGSGTVVFRAKRPCQPGVVVEAIVQPLAVQHRKPKARDWKTKAFVAFSEGSLEFALPLEKGAYALAFRYVNAETGQETERAMLGKVTVGAPGA